MYEFEIGKAVKNIKESEAKHVVIQLPDGLKPQAASIVKEIEVKTGVKPHVLLGTNFGACDLPIFLEKDYELLIHFGHTPFKG
jgi:2-(3-amino-3-carboxypropyl)histidine synthase